MWIWSAVGSHLGRLVKRVVSIAILLAVAYFLIQNYGSPATRQTVNDVISRITALL
jgi:lipopolysaccharide export LptBFGC system permease protein LptF